MTFKSTESHSLVLLRVHDDKSVKKISVVWHRGAFVKDKEPQKDRPLATIDLHFRRGYFVVASKSRDQYHRHMKAQFA